MSRVRYDNRKLREIVAKAPERADRWLASVASDIADDIKLQFNTGPAGRTYRRGGIVHIASAPGYPPNVDTGRLRASIRSRRIKRLHYQVEDGTEYGLALEIGSEARKLRPRPFFTPVITEWRQRKLRERIDDLVRGLFGG
jgi:hypothetical protein